MRMGLYLPEESWLLLFRQANRLKQAVCFYLCHDHKSMKQEKPLFCAFSCLTACLNCVSNYHVAGQSSQCYTEHVVTWNQIEIPSARSRLENNGITGKIKSLCFLFFWRYFVLLVFDYFASPTSPFPSSWYFPILDICCIHSIFPWSQEPSWPTAVESWWLMKVTHWAAWWSTYIFHSRAPSRTNSLLFLSPQRSLQVPSTPVLQSRSRVCKC